MGFLNWIYSPLILVHERMKVSRSLKVSLGVCVLHIPNCMVLEVGIKFYKAEPEEIMQEC